METCEQHQQMLSERNAISKEISNLSLTIALLNRTLDAVEKRMFTHIDEGEKPGGHRDRLLKLETEHEQVLKDISDNRKTIENLEKNLWRYSAVCGIVSGAIVAGVREIIHWILKLPL